MAWRRGNARRTRLLGGAAIAAGVALASIATPVGAQLLPPSHRTTTTAPPATDSPTTAAPAPPPTDATTTTAIAIPTLPDQGSGPTTTAAPGAPPDAPPADPGAPPSDGSVPAPGADGAAPVVDDDAGASGLSPLGGDPGQVIPADAQQFLAHLHHTAPNDNRLLVEAEQALLAAGHDPEEAARLAYGHFPVAGPAHWVDDWLDPRFTGTTFRYHYGIDLIAPFGTPLRSPADGRVLIQQGPLGGLTVEVVLPDGTFYELAHLSALAPEIAAGHTVHTGDLLGFVGTSGDATGPHCHFGLWVKGSTPTSPKPQLDQWVADAAAAAQVALAPVRAGMRPGLGTSVTRSLVEDTDGPTTSGVNPASADLLLASAGSPAGGALQVAQATVSRLASGVDWTARSVVDDERRAASRTVATRVSQLLRWLVPGAAGALAHASD